MGDDFGGSILVHSGAATPLVENRETYPEEPGYGSGNANRGALAHAYYSLGFGEQYREDRISPEKAMTYSAFWGCVRVIAQSLAGVGWHVFERSADGRSKRPLEDDVGWCLDLQANPEMSSFDWRQVMLVDALVRGNGYSEIERTNGGRFLWLWRIAPERVTPFRDTDDDSLWYEVVNGTSGPPSYLRPSDIFHLKGLGPDGLVGWAVWELAARSIKLGLAEEQFGSKVFSKGPMPGGVLTTPKNLNPQQRAETKRSFEAAYSGTSNQMGVIVLSDGTTFTPTTLPNDATQFLESRKFQVSEICRWFGVPPHKLADLDRATFSNIEEQERAFVTDSLLPWARRLENEADLKLFSFARQGRRFTRLNLDALMRGNSTTQTATVTQKVSGGLMTPNEGRTYFDMNPVPEGDVLLIQGAMIPLEQAVNPPEPPPAAPPPEPPAPPTSDDEPPGNPPPEESPEAHTARRERTRRTFAPLLTDVYARLLRVDADKAKRAGNKGKLSEHIASWYTDAETRVQAALTPVFRALWSSDRRAEERATLSASRYVRECRESLQTLGVSVLTRWESRPQELAERDLRDYSEDQERDELGRFGSGGGGGDDEDEGDGDKGGASREEKEAGREESGKADAASARQEERDAEDEQRESQREQEDTEVEEARDQETEQIQEQRDAEDTEVNEVREQEDAEIDEQRAEEDTEWDETTEAIQSERDAEDEATQAQRDAEDAEAEQKQADFDEEWYAEDNRLTKEREAEDDRIADERQVEVDRIDAEREAARDAVHEERLAKEDALENSPEWDAMTPEQVDAEHARYEAEADKQYEALEKKWEKEDSKREKQWEREDAVREKERERNDAERHKADERFSEQMEKESSQREARREKEDEKVSARREKEDEQREREREKIDEEREAADERRQATRDKEDSQREKRWEKEDKERGAKREREDKEREAKREKEDRERERKRAMEDKQ